MAIKSLPTTMLALLHNQKLGSLAVRRTSLPTPSSTQYLIKCHAAALTTGELLWPRPKDLNISTPGCEFVGEVFSSPSPTSKFQPGDKVYARVTYPQPGGARQYTVSDDTELALRPQNISANEAAAIPVSALTAWQALFEELQVSLPPTKSNQHILITNASGGVGLWAVQLAKLAGLHVTGTTSSANTSFVKSLGADVVLDYRKTNIKEYFEHEKVDLVFDCIGGTSLAQAWHALKTGGHLRTIVPPADMQWKFELDTPPGAQEGVKGRFFVMRPDGEQLAKITKLVEQELVKPVVDSVFMLEDFQAAFDKVASGRARGKVVLEIPAED
jgi:NADPH:quinone reductase-like Zn-dependent oxidoreductase